MMGTISKDFSYREFETKRGTMLGGPMYALEKGLGWKWLAVLFALFAALKRNGLLLNAYPDIFF